MGKVSGREKLAQPERCNCFFMVIYRNEVWRYDVKQFGTHGTRVAKFMLRGLPLGAALAAGTIALEMALGLGGGHGHDEHGAGAGHH